MQDPTINNRAPNEFTGDDFDAWLTVVQDRYPSIESLAIRMNLTPSTLYAWRKKGHKPLKALVRFALIGVIAEDRILEDKRKKQAEEDACPNPKKESKR